MALEEPCRHTILMRYFDGLPPREIAKREGAPIATVKGRLACGLEQLRSRLDTTHGGDRRTWVGVLAPPRPPRVLRQQTVNTRWRSSSEDGPPGFVRIEGGARRSERIRRS